MPFAGMSPSRVWPIGPSSRVSAVFASRNRNGRSRTWMRGKNDSKNPVVWNAMSTMPVCLPDTILTSLPSWPPENTWMRTAPPVLAATSSENFVATAWVGCSGVSGWPSLRVTAPWAKARPDRQIAGAATASPAAEARNCLRVMFEVMGVLPASAFRRAYGISGRLRNRMPWRPSIRRPPARNVEHRAGRERALRRGAERHQAGDLLDLDEATARDLCEHVGDVLLGHLVEDRSLGDGRGHAIDRDVVARQFLAQRFRQRDHAGFGGRVRAGIGVAFLAGDRRNVDDAAVVLRDHQRG